MSLDIINFQTPEYVCEFMADMVPAGFDETILESTPGAGNLKSVLRKRFAKVCTPLGDYFDLDPGIKFGYVVMNPPFSPMAMGYKILESCMLRTNNIIALMPWLTIINGQKRNKLIFDFGVKSITHLPRNVFNGSRVQCCILEMDGSFKGDTIFKNFNG